MSVLFEEPRIVLTHKQAVTRAALWLRNTHGCAIVMAERRVNGTTEQPDAVGWRGNGESTLVECKVSRSDFLADRDKSFRRYEDTGVGSLRYFAAPRGLLKKEEMPEGWGLLEIDTYRIWHRQLAAPKQANKAAEVIMLVSAMRRLELSATVFVRQEDEPAHQQGRSDDGRGS